MRNKDDIFDNIIALEGGYTDNPDDSGGETMYGITVDVARVYGYLGAMCDMPKELAKEILTVEYWDSVEGDDIYRLSPRVAIEAVDTAVNCGVGTAGTILQRSLNVLNQQGDLYDDLEVDGRVGPQTLSALSTYLVYRSEETLLKALNVLQGARYIELAEKREKDETFIYGWLNNRVGV